MNGLTTRDQFSRRKFLSHVSAIGVASLLVPWHTAGAEPPPKMGNVLPSHLYLERLQKAAYAELGYSAPTFSAESLLRRKVEILHMLREGGAYEIELKKSLKAKGLDEALSQSILEKQRRGAEQVASHHNVERILKEYSDTPTQHVHPFHHIILKNIQSDINALYKKSPLLSFAGELQKLDGRVTLSTLPTGQVNARTQVVPETDEYLIVLDPVFFDFLYNISNNLAQAINPEKALEGAKQYAVSGQERPLGEAINYGDPSVTMSFFVTLNAFLRRGFPPPPEPSDDKIFSLAENFLYKAALFVVAHEYSHILLGHMHSSSAPQGHSQHGRPRSTTWERELEADWLACSISDAVLAASGFPPPVRFMGVHFFFISTMLLQLVLAAFQKPEADLPQQLTDFTQNNTDQDRPANQAATLRFANVNLWLERKYPSFAYRGTQYFAALLLEVATALWQNVTQHILLLRAENVKPPLMWTWSEIFEQAEQSDR